jgi:hypothetical protein
MGADEAAADCAFAGVAELPGEPFFLSQPANKIEAAITPAMISFFIKYNVVSLYLW